MSRTSSEAALGSRMSAGAIMSGTKKSLRRYRSMPVNFGGATPMTVNGWPLMSTRRPRTERSDPKSCSQQRWPRTTTASRPSTWCSSGLNDRPSTGSTPIDENRLALTSEPTFNRGRSPGRVAKPTVET